MSDEPVWDYAQNHTVPERDLSPNPEDQENDVARPDLVDTKKRKHSAAALPSPATPTPSEPQYIDSSTIAAAPILVPSTSTRLPASEFEFHATRSYPMNRGGFRYTACGPSLPSLGILPLAAYKTIPCEPEGIRFAWEDRSPFVLITEDGRTITAETGWRAARGNVSLREGNWYWEVKIERGGGEGGRGKEKGAGEGSWVRVGVGRRESSISAPAGIDGHSYAYKDRSGDAVTLSRPTPYGQPFGTSSTIGIFLSLPPRSAPSATDRRDPARIVRKRVPIRYKGQLYFESREYATSKEMEDINEDPANRAKVVGLEETKAAPGTKSKSDKAKTAPPSRIPPKLPGSRIAFFLDGVCQGVAFEDLYDFLPLRLPDDYIPPRASSSDKLLEVMENYNDDGTLGYYPLVSVFGGGIASINPGPDFAFPPPSDIDALIQKSPRPSASTSSSPPSTSTSWRPLSERYDEYFAEQARLDAMDELIALKMYQSQHSATAQVSKGRGTVGPALKRNKPSNVLFSSQIIPEEAGTRTPTPTLPLTPSLSANATPIPSNKRRNSMDLTAMCSSNNDLTAEGRDSFSTFVDDRTVEESSMNLD